MKSKNLLLIAAICLLLILSFKSNAQLNAYVRQVVTSNSGRFEYTPPYNDYVTLQSYNPLNKKVNTFGTIYTQSSQSIVISGNYGFFAAQDSIVKYDLNDFKRMAAITDSGLNRMIVYKGKLLVSKQYPVSSDYLEVLDTANLSLIAEVKGISGDCGGISSLNDTVYVAVNSGYMGTEGKLAVIDPSSWTLKAEVNFGHKAVGIMEIYQYKSLIFSVNKTPYGVIDTGSVTIYTPANRNFTNVFLPVIVGAGSGIKDSLLYLGLNYGIGSFNMNTLKIADTAIIKDPGSSVYTYIISSAIDTLEGRIYTNVGDYQNAGYCLVTSIKGDSIDTYPTGISSDAVAVDTRFYGTGMQNNTAQEFNIKLYPNPVQDRLKITFANNINPASLMVTDISGREILELKSGTQQGPYFELPVNALAPGIYYLVISTSEGRIVRTFAVAAH
jgi:hypothetical protein